MCYIASADFSPDRKTLKMKYARGAAPFVPQITAAEFAAALKTNGFRVIRAKIEDATGQCPGVRWSAVGPHGFVSTAVKGTTFALQRVIGG
jgi:hypothetical protein